MQIRVEGTSMDDSIAQVAKLEGKLQEAIKLAAGGGQGLAFEWNQPAR